MIAASSTGGSSSSHLASIVLQETFDDVGGGGGSSSTILGLTGSSVIETIVSYPTLLAHEDTLIKSPQHSVLSWFLYLMDIDTIYNEMKDLAVVSPATNTSTTTKRIKFKPRSIGGKFISTIDDVIPETSKLIQVRIYVGERALSIFPGSYKLWKIHLEFRIQHFFTLFHDIIASSTYQQHAQQQQGMHLDGDHPKQKEQEQEQEQKKHYQILYNLMIATFERSLVRLNKIPTIWRMYLDFVTKVPSLSSSLQLTSFVTWIRHLFDRSLISLPVTQHDKIWDLYITWVKQCTVSKYQTIQEFVQSEQSISNKEGARSTKDIDTKSDTTTAGAATTTRNVTAGNYLTNKLPPSYPTFLSSSTLIPMDIPIETTIRVLKRYVYNYNPLGREDYAMTCLSLQRYGECSKVLIELLNDTEFVSPIGTSRYDTWITFCEVCTKHPDEIEQLGINFDKIVRAAIYASSYRRRRTNISISSNDMFLSSSSSSSSSGQPNSLLIHANNTSNPFLFLQEEAGSSNKRLKKGVATERNKQQDTSTIELMDLGSSSSTGFLGNGGFGEMEGTLWCKLADYYTRLGEFEVARSICEEAMEHVTRVRDFSLVFDTYSRFEEATIAAHMTLMMEDEEDEEEDIASSTPTTGEGSSANNEPNIDKKQLAPDDEEDEEDFKILLDGTGGDVIGSSSSKDKEDAAIELEMARAEYLMDRRPLLLNRVILKQNPNNIREWLHRSKLYINKMNSYTDATKALEEACIYVQASQAINGYPSSLWIELANLHETYLSTSSNTDDNDSEGESITTMKRIETVRNVYERVCLNKCYKFHSIDDYAKVWTSWVEYELKYKQYDEALSIIRQAVAGPSNVGTSNDKEKSSFKRKRSGGGGRGGGKGAVGGLHKSLRLWNLALDMEESLGGHTNTVNAYERCIELGVATPQIILNYASYYKEHNYFDDSFRAYEKGVELFTFPDHPGATHLWYAYLKDFIKRYEGTKIERTRSLFERCIEHVPTNIASQFYLMYGQFEETYGGFIKRALKIYERLCIVLPPNSHDKYKAYQIYIAKAQGAFGPLSTRPIYEAAISSLGDNNDATKICLSFANLETQLGEIERARAVLTYGAELANPRQDTCHFWKIWHAFEIAHGDEESFRDMLLLKRTITTKFSTITTTASASSSDHQGTSIEGFTRGSQTRSNVDDANNIVVNDKVNTGGRNDVVLTEEEALRMIEEQEGVKHTKLPTIGGFVTRSKRSSTTTNVDDLERKAARLREATSSSSGGAVAAASSVQNDEDAVNDKEEIDLDE